MSDAAARERLAGLVLAATAGALSVALGVRLVGGDAVAQVISGGKTGDGAGMVSQINGYCLMTSHVGNDDIVLVLDNRSETVLVYRTDQNNSVQFLQRVGLARIFTDARARYQGRD